jgi:hypothetical protein
LAKIAILTSTPCRCVTNLRSFKESAILAYVVLFNTEDIQLVDILILIISISVERFKNKNCI